MPVLEALLDPRTTIHQVVVARNAAGEAVDRILDEATARGITIQRADARRVTHLSGNGRHDQGVVASVVSPGLADLDDWLVGPASHGPLTLLLLDGLTNPANVGMIIRTVVAAGLAGVVLPRTGSPDVGPLVVKASAGVALFAPVLQAATSAGAAGALAAADISLVGLSAGAGPPLWDTALPERMALVLGNETSGLSPAVAELVDSWCSIPLDGGVESLNVASAAAVVAFEVARRRRSPPPRPA